MAFSSPSTNQSTPPRSPIRFARLLFGRRQRHSRRYALVEFSAFAAASGAAEAAVKLNGEVMMGRYLKIELSSSDPDRSSRAPRRSGPPATLPEGSTTVFVKNLPYDANDAAVREAFASCGHVSAVRLAKWQHTERLKGFGYVEVRLASCGVRLRLARR